MSKVQIYTDGACSGNPGNGGYGVLLRYKGHQKEISEGFRRTTNNRMELLAVIIALKAMKVENLDIDVFTDSKYVSEAVEKGWLWNWQKKGFAGKKNSDLWRAFIPLYKKHKVKFNWVKGHAGHPENERCDQLAVEASRRSVLNIDQGYEAEN